MRLDKTKDITRSVKLIEWMKNELLMSVSDLFNILYRGTTSLDDTLQDILANIIMITYLLAKRLGINYKDIDYKVKEKIKIGIDEEHSIEKWYGELSNLNDYINNRE